MQTATNASRSILAVVDNPLVYVDEVTDFDRVALRSGGFISSYDSLCREQMLRTVAVVEVHVSPPTATRLTRTLRVTPSEQLANFGEELS